MLKVCACEWEGVVEGEEGKGGGGREEWDNRRVIETDLVYRQGDEGI
jgi:hypothetical protein